MIRLYKLGLLKTYNIPAGDGNEDDGIFSRRRRPSATAVAHFLSVEKCQIGRQTADSGRRPARPLNSAATTHSTFSNLYPFIHQPGCRGQIVGVSSNFAFQFFKNCTYFFCRILCTKLYFGHF